MFTSVDAEVHSVMNTCTRRWEWGGSLIIPPSHPPVSLSSFFFFFQDFSYDDSKVEFNVDAPNGVVMEGYLFKRASNAFKTWNR